MGAQQTVQATPYNYTGSIDQVWTYIKSRLKSWHSKGTNVDLPIISNEHLLPSQFCDLKVDTGRYKANVIRVTNLAPNTLVMTIRVKRRVFKKKLDYQYGGVINFV